jgi:hypothetical protein
MFDRTLAEGLAFGASSENRGARVDAVDSDLGSFWMNTLEPALKEGPLTLAGLTAGAPLFCVELLCRDYGLRTVYRIEHVLVPDARVQHTITGPASLSAWTEALAAAGAEWPAVAAAVAADAARRAPPELSIELLDLRAHAHGALSLFSWMLAPPRVGAASAAILPNRD